MPEPDRHLQEVEAHTTKQASSPLPPSPRRRYSSAAKTKMLLLRAATPFAYAKVDKVDAEEARRLKAQYLIHKVLEESIPAAAAARSRSRVKARIGVRLKRLRLAVRGVRVRACRTVQRHLRSLRRLLVQGSGEPAASPS